MSRKKKEQITSRLYWQYQNYWMTRIMRLASSAIEWKGLPDYIDRVYLENCLNRSGSAILVYDEFLDKYAVGQNASVGNLDIYGYPNDRRVVFLNGVSQTYDPETSVIIYNNSMRMADIWWFEMQANEMADIDMAVRVNVQSQKTMPMIPGSPQQQLTIENIYNSLQNNLPYIILDRNSINPEELKGALTFDNRKSFTSDLMIQVQREKWNRILTMLGINNLNYEKRERVNVPEINSNLDEILVMRRDRLNSRERACQQMKDILGLDVEVSYYSDVANKGGEMNGDFYYPDSDNRRAVLASEESGTGVTEQN